MTDNFFNELQKHSEAKLKILKNYVVPWMRKIILGQRKYYERSECLIIDGFAGQGKYSNKDEESYGSPFILLNEAIEFCNQADAYSRKRPEIYLIFVENQEDNFLILRKNLNDYFGIKFDHKEGLFTNVPDYPSIKLACINGEFKNIMHEILESELIHHSTPIFCFIDPYGFKDTPLSTISKIMKNGKSEILLNFIYEETNRFLTYDNQKIQEYMAKYFGVGTLERFRELVSGQDAHTRKKLIVDFYSRQLIRESGAKYVLDFEIKKSGKTKLILFFGTKNKVGLKLMKDVMWKVDETGLYLFDDRKDSNQIEFNFTNTSSEAAQFEDLANIIYKTFTNRNKVTKEMIEDFVITQTIYPAGKYITKSLNILEKDKRILDVKKINGGIRKSGYKDVYINFK